MIANLEDKLKEVDSIILYGSVAKGEAVKESDVDIFVDTKESKLQNWIKKILKDFYESKEYALFRVKGIDNELSVKVGELKEWKELQRDIASSGIILYSKYKSRETPIGAKHQVIFYWDKIGKNRGAFLNKVYGVKIKGKKYPGFLEKSSGRKMGKSCISIPFGFRDKMIKILKDYKVSVKSSEVFSL